VNSSKDDDYFTQKKKKKLLSVSEWNLINEYASDELDILDADKVKAQLQAITKVV